MQIYQDLWEDLSKRYKSSTIQNNQYLLVRKNLPLALAADRPRRHGLAVRLEVVARQGPIIFLLLRLQGREPRLEGPSPNHDVIYGTL